MTITTFGLTLALLAAVAALYASLRAWLEARGTRLVTCPETREPVGVELDAAHATITTLAGRRELRLRDCTRWPEKKGCGQMCLDAIEEAPHDCLVREVLRRWHEDKGCALCGRRIAPVRWHDRKPALKAPDGRIWEWAEVPPEQLPAMLASARAVCWSCMIAEGFRRDHPELVVDRPRPPRAARHP